jgi:2-oxoglutarate dehydrogenase E1 component
MTSVPITGVYNDGYIAQQHERYRGDPNSVEESWRQYFRMAEQLSGPTRSELATTVSAEPTYLRKVAGAAALIDAIRHYGHLAVQLDPLGTPPPGAMELHPAFHGIVEEDLPLVPGYALGFDVGTAADVAQHLRQLYASNMGFEFEHLEDEAEREWFRDAIEGGAPRSHLTPDEKKAVLHRLTQVDGLERFIGRAYVNVKRFSIEGTDALVPMLDAAIDESTAVGAREVVIGMAHRGRINVLTHILDKPYGEIFNEFDGKHADDGDSETGDVKYHLGAYTEKTFSDGRTVAVTLVPNPSHLEVVNPVLAGLARARQTMYATEELERDEGAVLPILVHGDAAFPGEGVVAETFNLSRLRAYRIGGTLHIISNNQVGFTTDPIDARSTYYASDLAKGFEVPIVHVNADDAEACIAAVRLGIAYRQAFGKDFLIDVVGYRRHGHNEGDEPSYTQPALYTVVRAHPTPRQVWGARLVSEGILSAEDVDAMDRQVADTFAAIHSGPRPKLVADAEPDVTPGAVPVVTALRAEQLIAVNERLLVWPEDFHVHPRLRKQLERRREALGDAGGIDWGHAEALALGTILTEGFEVRMTGQDVERGTFSHRHAVLNDVMTGDKYCPLQHLPGAAAMEICNSPLSETAVLGFEYGYSTATPGTLVLWEAQFGDFANVAQPIFDQFLAADHAKWGQDSGVVLLLPHGYEGQGPEHSSARLERYLQSCAEGNLRVAYPSTPAQYFHILRRQAHTVVRRPLVLMQPKSLLRLPQASSRLADLAQGSFQSVLDDPAVEQREDVTRLVFCTGKLYYELSAKEHASHLAVVRVEELYPWPHEMVSHVVDLYPNIVEIVWAQEEPKNMGAWSYVAPRLRASAGNAVIIRYVGRPERASPAEGYLSSHQAEQARIVADVQAAPQIPGMGARVRAVMR